jgi:DNA-directed RNA polymerase specialized sigma24 family protein
MTPAKTKNAEQKFGDEVSKLLQPYNDKGSSLLNFIKGRIRRWNLNDITPEDILHDAILQGLRDTRETGKEILCPEAWLRIASQGILKNRVRKNIRQEELPKKLGLITPLISNDPALMMERADLSTQLTQAYQNLSDEDQEILTLYFNEDRTYEQIQKHFKYLENKTTSLATIRKRVSRAKERAIKAFHEICGLPSQDKNNPVQDSEKLNARRIQPMDK